MSASGSGNLAYDTERQYIGTVYAKGLLGAAEKANQVTQVVDELESIVVDVLPQLPKLKLLLESPRVPMEVKEKVLNQSFSAGSSVLLTFLKVVCRHGRFDCLRVISRTATALLQEQTGVVEVRVTTAELVPESMHEELKTKLNESVRWENITVVFVPVPIMFHNDICISHQSRVETWRKKIPKRNGLNQD